MKLFAIVCIAAGALFVAAAAILTPTHAARSASTSMIATFDRIGVPFLGFGIWAYTKSSNPDPASPERLIVGAWRAALGVPLPEMASAPKVVN